MYGIYPCQLDGFPWTSLEEVLRVYYTLMVLFIQEITVLKEAAEGEELESKEESETTTNTVAPLCFSYLPYTPLHEAAERVDVSLLRELLALQNRVPIMRERL